MASSATVVLATMTSPSVAQLALLCAVGMLLVTATAAQGIKVGLNGYAQHHTTHEHANID